MNKIIIKFKLISKYKSKLIYSIKRKRILNSENLNILKK